MSLAGGVRLGVYRVESLLGAGGMGEVYLARDTRLERDVALKVLPDLFASQPDRLARFEREARVLAALKHPNIAAIYGLEEGNGVQALVLELVEGETLADRVARGPLPLQEALTIARQIAEAIEAAHESGIIHRDLKPANIKVTPAGVVKVLDFGLAKAFDMEASRPEIAVSASPTFTSPAATHLGVIIGTASYMSPEQARGKAVDKRSDVWAFGCVLYEMLTGRRAFEGDEVTDVIARIIEREIDLSRLPATTPPSIRRLLRRTLEKDRNRRLADAADARLDIDEALSGAPVDATVSRGSGVAARPSTWRAGLPWAIAAAGLLAAATAVLLWAPWRSAPTPAPVRLSSEIGVDGALATDQGASAVPSPDGSLLVFAAEPAGADSAQLYVRRLDQLQSIALAGTEGARNPFFSPDGQWLAFFAGGKLKKVAVSGGAVVTLCDAPNGRGGTWTDEGSIIFSPANTPGTNLLRVSAAGGKPEPFDTLEQGEVTQRWPQALPGGAAVLYTSASSTTQWENANLVIQPLHGGTRKIVVRGGYYGRYVSSGHLLYVHEGSIFAAPFDLDRLEVTGPSAPAVQGVTSSPTITGGGQFAVGSNGALIYVPGRATSSDDQIAWMDRTGKTSVMRAMPANWSNPVFSPDGARLAIDISDGKQSDVWIYDWMRDTLSRLTFDPSDDVRPAWTPDGTRIAFSSKRRDGVRFNLYWQRADGGGDATPLTESANDQYPGSFHPKGKFLVFLELTNQTAPAGSDLMLLPIDGSEATAWKVGTPTAFLKTPQIESTPMFSTDGRWVAYLSNENGRNDLFVRPFPGPGGKWQISTAAADDPMWSPNRRELFFASNPGLRLMVAGYSTEGGVFRAERPQLVSETRFVTRPRAPSRDIALHPDGQRFAIALAPPEETITRLDKVVIVFNFLDELRRIAPAPR